MYIYVPHVQMKPFFRRAGKHWQTISPAPRDMAKFRSSAK
jgi:hypothetical protein